MSSIRLIVSDIDGTILDPQHQVDPDLIELIPQLQEKKIPFILASARSPIGIAPISRRLGVHQEPIACYNGALIIKGEEILFEHSLNKDEIRTFLHRVEELDPNISINCYSGSVWFNSREDQWTQVEASITGETPQIQPLSQTLSDDALHLHKLLLIGETQNIQELYQKLDPQEFPQTAFYLSKENYLEVTAKSVSKRDAVLELAAYYQVPLEQVMTIGDHFNDLPMIRLAGLGVAMGNAPEAVQKEAQVVTSSNQEHGVAKAIQEYVLQPANK